MFLLAGQGGLGGPRGAGKRGRVEACIGRVVDWYRAVLGGRESERGRGKGGLWGLWGYWSVV